MRIHIKPYREIFSVLDSYSLGWTREGEKCSVIWTSWFKACKYFASQSHRCFLLRNVNPRWEKRKADIALSSSVRETTTNCSSIRICVGKYAVRKIKNGRLKNYTGEFSGCTNNKKKPNNDYSNIEISVIYKRLEVKKVANSSNKYNKIMFLIHFKCVSWKILI